MNTFTCLPVTTLEAPMSRVFECGADCKAQFRLCDAVVWSYALEDRIQIRAFCTHLHALELMPIELLGQA